MSTIWEDTYGCTNQYMCVLDICLMNLLSYLYRIIIYCSINKYGHRNNVVEGLNVALKCSLKG